MGLLGDVGDMLGLGAPDVTSASAELTPEQERFRGNLRDIISTQMESPEDSPLVGTMRRGAREEIASQRQNSEDQLTSNLEKRGMNESGIAAEGLQNVGRSALQQQTQAERNLQQTIANLRQQGLQAGQNLSGQDVNLATKEAQMQNRANQAAQQSRGGITGSIAGSLAGSPGSLEAIGSGISWMMSDQQLKKNVEYTGEEVAGVPVVEFEWNEEAEKNFGLEAGSRHKGVLAEDVEEKHPELVGEHEGYKAIKVEA